jgi:hypothetical protein
VELPGNLGAEHPLEEKLRSSDAYHSLVMEKEVAGVLAHLGWRTIHSCFFMDPETGKLREVDVVARQLWKKKSRRGDKLVRIHIIVECKSARDYHLLFSREEVEEVRKDMFLRLHAEWIGWESQNRSRLIAALSELGVSSRDLLALSEGFSEWAYPNEVMSVDGLHLEPSDATLYSSAFRETNTKNEKDLDSSVLWRAGQSVLAAVQGFREEIIKFHLSWMAGAAKSALQAKESVVDKVKWVYSDHARMIDLYHPVVVIESPLWVIEELTLKRVESCRLVRRGQAGTADTWFDVVSRTNLEAYLSLVSQHYSRLLRRARARLDQR